MYTHMCICMHASVCKHVHVDLCIIYLCNVICMNACKFVCIHVWMYALVGLYDTMYSMLVGVCMYGCMHAFPCVCKSMHSLCLNVLLISGR